MLKWFCAVLIYKKLIYICVVNRVLLVALHFWLPQKGGATGATWRGHADRRGFRAGLAGGLLFLG